ncbi:MAG TPA: LptF/LptG family permease [Thermoanaerobaculia bacterium]|jgi:LPS export ABC transporter permease LptG/LPS export ABC transporter permease LptF
MRLISRSVLREIWPPFLLGFAAYTFILLVRTIFLMADFFVRRSASLSEVAWLVLLSIPWIVVLTLPMAFLLGVLIGIGRLSGDSELVALRSCGVGPGALYRPTLGAAAVLSAGVFLFYNLVLPRANDELTRSMARLAATSVVNLVEPRSFREPRPGVTLFFDRIGADGRSFDGVFLKLGEDDERNNRVIVARRGALALDQGRLWLDLFSSIVHDVDPANPSRYRTNRNEFQRILFSEDIEETVQSRITYEKGLRAQSLSELLKIARRLRGVSPERRRLALVEIHKKFSIPFACFAFAFVGIPLAETFRRGGKGSGFAISLAILVVYYVLISNGESWAQDGRMNAALAMWLPNLVLVGFGLAASRRAGRERGRWTLRLRHRREQPSTAPETSRRAWFGGFLRFPALLDRYVLGRFFSTLLLVFASVLLLSVIVDYSDKADEILTNHPPGSVVAGYYQAFLFSIAMDLAPFAVLIAALVSLGIFSKNNEDTAFKASGVSARRLGAPIFVAAALGAVLAFSLGEYALPIAKQREIRYRNRISGHPADWKLRTPAERNWYYARDGRIWHREEGEGGSGTLAFPSIYQFDSAFELVRRTAAREATWDETSRTWILRQGWTREFRGGETLSFATFLEERTVGDPPSAFFAERRLPEEMRFRELQRYTRRLRRSGYPTAALETALQSKIAGPLLLPVMALLAIPFAFRIGRRGALAGIGVGLALGMVFLIANALFTKLGDVGALPPPLAAWSPHVLFSTAAAFLLVRLRT